MSLKTDLTLHGIRDGWLVSMTEDNKGDTSPAPLLASDTDSITTDLSSSPSPSSHRSQPSFLRMTPSQPQIPSLHQYTRSVSNTESTSQPLCTAVHPPSLT